MFSSLPDYRRFAEAALQRIRKDHKHKSSNRRSGMLFNVLLLAGLWGLPLYARWVVVPDIHRSTSEPPPPPLIGKWRAANGTHFSITFREDGLFVLSREETVVETARYWFKDLDEKEIVLADFRGQPGDRPFPEEHRCWLSISLKGNKLSTFMSLRLDDDWRKNFHWHRFWEIEGEELDMSRAAFERVE